jgi:hypothetical protein
MKNQFPTRKGIGGYQANIRKEEKPKPEEHEGMPRRQHYPHEKRRGDRKLGTHSAMKNSRKTLHEFP